MHHSFIPVFTLHQMNKDGSSYPPNSVVVGMYEGYYSHPEVGGVSHQTHNHLYMYMCSSFFLGKVTALGVLCCFALLFV